MGVKDLIKKMEELSRNGAETPGTSNTPAPDLEAPVAASPLSTPVQSSENDNGVSTSSESNSKDARADGVSGREEAPPSQPAQPASTASTQPPENGAAVPEDPEKKAKKVCVIVQLPAYCCGALRALRFCDALHLWQRPGLFVYVTSVNYAQ